MNMDDLSAPLPLLTICRTFLTLTAIGKKSQFESQARYGTNSIFLMTSAAQIALTISVRQCWLIPHLAFIKTANKLKEGCNYIKSLTQPLIVSVL